MIIRNLTISFLTSLFVAATACSNSNFSGANAGKKSSPSQEENSPDDDEETATDEDEQDPGPEVTSEETGSGSDNQDGDLGEDLGSNTGDDLQVDQGEATEPEGLLETNGELSARPDYTACTGLPQAGKRGYGKCDANAVVVIVNDGKAQEMTCCPLGGKRILSDKPAELQMQKTGLCGPDEVLTGMVEPQAPTIFCSKINAAHLKLSSPVPSQYVNGNAPGIMGQIASSYNVSDTCICPEGTVAIGGHTASDNQCREQCVKILKK